MKKKLSQQRLKEIFQPLETANNSHQKIYPDLLKNQQPLHTVYGGAHLFKSNLVEKLGNTAKKNIFRLCSRLCYFEPSSTT